MNGEFLSCCCCGEGGETISGFAVETVGREAGLVVMGSPLVYIMCTGCPCRLRANQAIKVSLVMRTSAG